MTLRFGTVTWGVLLLGKIAWRRNASRCVDLYRGQLLVLKLSDLRRGPGWTLRILGNDVIFVGVKQEPPVVNFEALSKKRGENFEKRRIWCFHRVQES